MKEFWMRIEHRLNDLGCFNDMALQPGASESDLSALERHIGIVFPNAVKKFLAVHDGQEGFSLICGQ